MTVKFLCFNKYQLITEQIDISQAKAIGKMRHYFFPVPEADIKEALKKFNPFPIELIEFYNEIGFGFMHRKGGTVNCLLDPMSLVNLNLQLGDNKYDIQITEAMQDINIENQLLFFKSDTSCYFSISRSLFERGNPIFYRGKEIEKSLYLFLKYYDKNPSYLNQKMRELDRLIAKEQKEKEN